MIKEWISIAARPQVCKRCVKTALIVGTLLMLINYFDRLLTGQMGMTDWFKVALTFCVPYLVCTSASVGAIMENRNKNE
jgi:hypothetical protein